METLKMFSDSDIEQVFASEAEEVLEWLNSPGKDKPLSLEQWTVCHISDAENIELYDLPIFRLEFKFQYGAGLYAAFKRRAY